MTVRIRNKADEDRAVKIMKSHSGHETPFHGQSE